MKRFSYRPYVILTALVLGLMALPRGFTEKLRSGVIRMCSPTWRGVQFCKSGFIGLLTISPHGMRPLSPDEVAERERLLQENELLKAQVEAMREWLVVDDRIEEQLNRLKQIAHLHDQEAEWRDFFHRRGAQLAKGLEMHMKSLPAKVVFREPANWSSVLWINVGESDNEAMKKCVVAENSPVLAGTSLVGVVEYVGRKQSRVRLITDSRLVPAVRATRGVSQNGFLLDHLEPLLYSLCLRDDLFKTREEVEKVLALLGLLKQVLSQATPDLYLAKGEIHGSSSPVWRSRSKVLKGVGFNYDYADEEGPARDLRSGVALDSRRPPVALLKAGDLLVTSGLDGVFPAGLHVAVVSRVERLREGASSYEIEAHAAAGNLNELDHVLVLPPAK